MNFNGAAAAPREIEGARSEATAADVNVRRLIIRQILPVVSGERVLPSRLLPPLYWDYLLTGKSGLPRDPLLVGVAIRLREHIAIVTP